MKRRNDFLYATAAEKEPFARPTYSLHRTLANPESFWLAPTLANGLPFPNFRWDCPAPWNFVELFPGTETSMDCSLGRKLRWLVSWNRNFDALFPGTETSMNCSLGQKLRRPVSWDGNFAGGNVPTLYFESSRCPNVAWRQLSRPGWIHKNENLTSRYDGNRAR